jgi:glycosyltransferase involved in cell wall biosynthesis
VTDTLTIDGGSAKVALGSARALADSGLTVTVFAAAGRADADLTSAPNLRIVCTDQGEALADRNKLGGALRGLWNRKARIEMDRLLATLDPERTVVHVHGWTKALSSSVIASISRAKFPIVVTLHEYFVACPTGCLYLHRDRRVCTLKPMSVACMLKDCDSRSYAFKLYRVLRQLIQRSAGSIPRKVPSYITVSAFSRGILKPFLPRTSRFFPVDNPVDARREARVEAEANEKFVFIGRLSPEKGGALLARAAREAGAKVVFVGDGIERDEIARIYPEAMFTAWLDRDGVREQLRSARCVVLPSLWYETLGLVVLEAAALGIPAIVPSGTAAFDLIEPGVSGLAFRRGDAGDLAAQLVACADDRLVERMSAAAYAAYWRNQRTIGNHTEQLTRVYHEMLGSAATHAGAVRVA